MYLDVAVGVDLDIGRFQIAMDDTALVRGFKRSGNLQRDWERRVYGNRAALNALTECFALDQFQHDRLRPGVLLESIHRADVGMVQRGQQFCLALKSREPVSVGRKRVREDLDRDLALQPRIACAIHLAHPAASDQRDDFERPESRSTSQRHFAIWQSTIWQSGNAAHQRGRSPIPPAPSSETISSSAGRKAHGCRKARETGRIIRERPVRYHQTVEKSRTALPGGDLIEKGLADRRSGLSSIEGLLVSIGAPRLAHLGVEVTDPIPQAERRLYDWLHAEDADSAHGRYNALIRRLVSFERAAARPPCAK